MLSFLKELITTNPFVEEINLENKGIPSLDIHSVDLLGRFTELKSINLADNHIRKLPDDLSQLSQILEFNVNGNPIEDLEAAVDSLSTMPQLKVLHINLHEEEQVDYLLRTLTNLDYLNGLAVERDALFNEEEESQQDPNSDSFQQQQSVRDQEESTSRPQLQSAQKQIIVEDEEEESQRVYQYNQSQQPTIEEGQDSNEQTFDQINGLQQEEEAEDEEEVVQAEQEQRTTQEDDDCELKASDLEQIAILYDQIRGVRRKVESNIDKKLAEDFDQHLKNIMYELSVKLQQIEEAQEDGKDYLRKKAIIETKQSLISMCFVKANEYLQKTDPVCGGIYQTLYSYMSNLCDKSLNLEIVKTVEVSSVQSQPDKQPDNSQVNKKLEEHDKIKTNIIEGLKKAMSSKDDEIALLRRQLQQKDDKLQQTLNELERQKKENSELLEVADTLEKDTQKGLSDKEYLQRELQDQKDQYEQHISGLEEENKKLLDTLIRHSKNKAAGQSQTSLVQSQISEQSNVLGNTLQANNSQVYQSVKPNNKQQYLSQTKQNPFIMGNQSSHGASQQFSTQNFTQSSSNKVLPLKQLKDIITDIYQQKIKYDIKCRESKLPVETMEQFMYTYLNQKYGLKSLIIEWASTIINGVRTYLKDDHEVTLFGKILKNECDEEFRFIQMHVKETLSNLLKILLREKHHLKSEGEINQLSEQVQNSFIEDWQWKKIVMKMYDHEDVNILTERFVEAINVRTNLKENTLSQQALFSNKQPNRKLSREEEIRMRKQVRKPEQKLLYSEFLKIILDFQLQEHEKFLSKFTQMFKSVDTDHNGIIDENEFHTLLIKMGIVDSEEDIESLLTIVDPHNNKQMTYSEIVQLLSSQMVPVSENSNKQVPLLEKFVTFMQQDPSQYGTYSEGGLGEQMNWGQNTNEMNELIRTDEEFEEQHQYNGYSKQYMNQDLAQV